MTQRTGYGNLTVAPRAGARIETARPRCRRPALLHVAPRVGAWIEIDTAAIVERRRRSPPAWGRGLKSLCAAAACAGAGRRPPRGGVDRNKLVDSYESIGKRRPPRGGVDRNTKGSIELRLFSVPPWGRGSRSMIAA